MAGTGGKVTVQRGNALFDGIFEVRDGVVYLTSAFGTAEGHLRKDGATDAAILLGRVLDVWLAQPRR